jgi:hypothetical protein
MSVGIGFTAYTHGFLTFTNRFSPSLYVKFLVVKIFPFVKDLETTTMFNMVGVRFLLRIKDALDTFNDRESGKFVFLIERRACHPSIN